VYEFVVGLLQPHPILCLLVGWALFRLWRKRKEPTRRLWPLLLPLFLLALLSTPAVGHLAALSLECGYPPVEERSADAQAVVVFSAGLILPEGPRIRAELDEDSLKRCLLAARLYSGGRPCPVLVSGGRVNPESDGPAPAAVMGDLLLQLGVRPSDLVLEERSRTTYENAVESARLLKERGIVRVALVVDAVDMPRAAACLRKQGVEVLPAPCHFRAAGFPDTPDAFLPSPSGAGGVQRAWHEWLGMLWYRLHGRL
jgi:uncharacterized SAM-binding protein YcdF (DUF218 family)